MRVLVACEFSGVVRDAFIAAGHEAYSCDLLPSERPGPHITDNVLYRLTDGWDLMIAHPPCTYLSRAGARWWKLPGRDALAAEAASFATSLYYSPIPKVCVENPIGQLHQRWRWPDQKIEPWEFGHKFSKATCLWLKNLPPLMPTAIMAEYVPLIRSNTGHGKRKGQQSHGGLAGGKEASRTFSGIAKAMAEQWG